MGPDPDRAAVFGHDLDREPELAAIDDLIQTGAGGAPGPLASAATCLMQTSNPTVA